MNDRIVAIPFIRGVADACDGIGWMLSSYIQNISVIKEK